jgi:hypothetical protein
MQSAGTGADAIRMNATAGGIDIDASGTIYMNSTNSTINAITVDASASNGGVVMASGTQGFYINSNGGALAFGSWSGGDVYLGTAAVARTINIGNTTTTTAVNVNSGTGGIVIGNDENTGEIQIGNTSSTAKTITLGNNNGSTRLITRWGTGGNIKHQPTITNLSDANGSVSVAALLTGILDCTPTADRTFTLPTAATVVSTISGILVNDCFEFVFINKSSTANDANIDIALGTGGSSNGSITIHPVTNNAGSYFTSGSGLFRLVMDNVTASSEAYTVYRLS